MSLKKIVWTLVFLSPIILMIISARFHKQWSFNDVLKLTTVYWSWSDFFTAVITTNLDVWKIVLKFFLAAFWTIPFWYAWKGTFIAHWAILRILLFAGTIFVPFLATIMALIGLWFKS